jgi:hypothetical protein
MTSEAEVPPPPTLREVRDKAQQYYVSYKRHATAVALMWGIFTCGFVVLNVIVFIQPQWIGRFDASVLNLTFKLFTKFAPPPTNVLRVKAMSHYPTKAVNQLSGRMVHIVNPPRHGFHIT